MLSMSTPMFGSALVAPVNVAILVHIRVTRKMPSLGSTMVPIRVPRMIPARVDGCCPLDSPRWCQLEKSGWCRL